MRDPFQKVRELASRRSAADWALREEIVQLRAAGFSLRAIAQAAGVSHDTVWRWVA
jgi:lambda repressor-like predicted transcriptional regulator